MKKSEGLLVSPRGDAEYKFKIYQRDLELSSDDLAPGRSICVIGAGSNAFAAGVKRWQRYAPKAFVMGVDPAEERYKRLDPAIINHDVRALGFPSDFEGFDLVISYHAVPKYFLMWKESEKHRKEIIDDALEYYDYGIADKEATEEEIRHAIYESFREMLRITKPGGRVKVYPVLTSAREGSSTDDEDILNRVTERLQNDYPGLQIRYFRKTRTGTATAPQTMLRGEQDYVNAGLELIKPA